MTLLSFLLVPKPDYLARSLHHTNSSCDMQRHSNVQCEYIAVLLASASTVQCHLVQCVCTDGTRVTPALMEQHEGGESGGIYAQSSSAQAQTILTDF